MKTSSSLALFGAILFLITGAGCASEHTEIPTNPNPTTTPTTTTIPPKLGTAAATSPAGYSFEYPTIFTATLQSDNASYTLTSDYSVTENPSGQPNGEVKHPFQADITVRAAKLDAALLRADSEIFAEDYTAFLQGKTANGLLTTTSISQKTAYSFSLGAEGINVRYIYLPVNEKQTVVFKFSSLGDVLKNSIKPKPIDEATERASFETILQTFTLTK